MNKCFTFLLQNGHDVHMTKNERVIWYTGNNKIDEILLNDISSVYKVKCEKDGNVIIISKN